MRTTFSKSANAVYIYLDEIKKGGVAKTHPIIIKEMNGEVNLDFDKNEQLVGIEILGANKILPKKILNSAEKLD